MQKIDRLVVVAAIENLIQGNDTGDNAKVIIAAFHHLKPESIISGEINMKDESGATSGMTDIGQVSFHEKSETQKTFGVQIAHLGKWKVWRSGSGSRSAICFKHFLSQGINSLESDREYFLEYDRQFTPLAFGYIGERKHWINIGPISLYIVRDVIVYGKAWRFPHLVITA